MKAHWIIAILGWLISSVFAKEIQLRDDLLVYHYPISTKSAEAQKYFDQGLVLYYGFQHEAAIASFKKVIELDPKCAMGWWGQAICAGPHINNPFMDSVAAKSAWEAIMIAKKCSKKSSPVEKELIQALSARYAWPPPVDRKQLDIAYANAMRDVWRKYPDIPDVGALFADAMMNLRPWDLFRPTGEPQPGTTEILDALDKVISMDSTHPGANHFYIHTIEASPFPAHAMHSANVLRDRVPGAPHLVHMPSHIDLRLGHYEDAIAANLKGVAVDSTWNTSGFYAYYKAHNFHFLAYAAMFEGRRELAMKAARDMMEQIPMELVIEWADFLDAFMATPMHVMVRFGMWEEILNEPAPAEELFAAKAFWRCDRAIALAALGRVKEAKLEFEAFQMATEQVPESRYLGNNPASVVLNIGLAMAEGELEYRKGDYDRAFKLLRKAVSLDDSLRYDEPWGWMMPVRHSLGALLLEQGMIADAEVVYREDLRSHPENGWALRGLSECLHKTNRLREAGEVDKRFEKSWARADVDILSSCFCRNASGK